MSTYKVNLNWTASINKIVEIEADSADDALEIALNRCVEHACIGNRNLPYAAKYETFIESLREDAIWWDNPDTVEYFLEDEICEVI